MIDNAYLVLSVSDIKRLLRAARASQRAAKVGSTNHCLVIENLEVKKVEPGDREPQICSSTFNIRVQELERAAKERIDCLEQIILDSRSRK